MIKNKNYSRNVLYANQLFYKPSVYNKGEYYDHSGKIIYNLKLLWNMRCDYCNWLFKVEFGLFFFCTFRKFKSLTIQYYQSKSILKILILKDYLLFILRKCMLNEKKTHYWKCMLNEKKPTTGEFTTKTFCISLQNDFRK